MPAVLATLGIGASILSTVWCEAIKFVPDLSSTPDFQNLSEQTRDVLSNEDGFATFQFGLYYYSQVQDIVIDSAGDTIVRVTDTCVEYGDDVRFDAAWKTARAFAMIAPIAAAVLAFGLYVSPCCIFYTRATWNVMACLFLIIIPAFQSFTLLFLASNACKDNPVIEDRMDQALKAISAGIASMTTITDAPVASGNTTDASEAAAENDTGDVMIDSDTEDALRSIYDGQCEWDWGTYANLVSMCLFFLTGLFMVVMGPPTRPPPKEPEIQTVTYEQKVDETGQNVVEEVDVKTETFNPSGGPAWANPAHQAKPY